MTVELDMWKLVMLFVAFIGALASFGVILLNQIDKRIDGHNSRVTALEKDLAEHKASLPLQYQRREDAIRFETVLNAKLDAIGSKFDRLMEKS